MIQDNTVKGTYVVNTLNSTLQWDISPQFKEIRKIPRKWELVADQTKTTWSTRVQDWSCCQTGTNG